MYQILLELSGEHPVQYWKYPQEGEDGVEILMTSVRRNKS